MSYTNGCTACGNNDPTFDCGGLNAVYRAAQDAGVLIVAIAGNEDHIPTACRISNIAIRPEVLGVAGYDGRDDTLSITQSPMGWGSRGGAAIRTAAGNVGKYSGVDVLAPSHGRLMYGRSDVANRYAENGEGTSLAAPIVSGSAALFKTAWFGLAGLRPTGKELIPIFLAMADSFNWISDGIPDTYAYAGNNVVSGGGRLRLRLPTSSQFSGPWEWGYNSFDMVQGDVRVGTTQTAFKHHRLAVTWYGDDTNNAADIDVKSWKVCGGVETLLFGQDDFDIRNRLHTRGVDVPAGCSLRQRIIAYALPAGTSVRVYSSYFLHNEIAP